MTTTRVPPSGPFETIPGPTPIIIDDVVVDQIFSSQANVPILLGPGATSSVVLQSVTQVFGVTPQGTVSKIALAASLALNAWVPAGVAGRVYLDRDAVIIQETISDLEPNINQTTSCEWFEVNPPGTHTYRLLLEVTVAPGPNFNCNVTHATILGQAYGAKTLS